MSGPVLAVIGPLVWPESTSGVHFPTCTHVAPQSCSKCDGSRNTGIEYDARAVTPTCMRKEET